jgi:hypothetical protein
MQDVPCLSTLLWLPHKNNRGSVSSHLFQDGTNMEVSRGMRPVGRAMKMRSAPTNLSFPFQMIPFLRTLIGFTRFTKS